MTEEPLDTPEKMRAAVENVAPGENLLDRLPVERRDQFTTWWHEENARLDHVLALYAEHRGECPNPEPWCTDRNLDAHVEQDPMPLVYVALHRLHSLLTLLDPRNANGATPYGDGERYFAEAGIRAALTAGPP
jgi:hypothetical protein